VSRAAGCGLPRAVAFVRERAAVPGRQEPAAVLGAPAPVAVLGPGAWGVGQPGAGSVRRARVGPAHQRVGSGPQAVVRAVAVRPGPDAAGCDPARREPEAVRVDAGPEAPRSGPGVGVAAARGLL